MSTLKKIKPNLSEVAKTKMAKFIDKIELPETINENEKHLYHVVLVEARFNQAKLEAEYKARVQTYDTRSWLAVKDRLKQIGHTNVYILHDPTIKVPKEKPQGGKGKNGGNANANGGGETPKEKRDRLIARAKELGYTGALNVKNSQFEEFIKNAEANANGGGENGADGGENSQDGNE